jgi:hypothetical protein
MYSLIPQNKGTQHNVTAHRLEVSAAREEAVTLRQRVTTLESEAVAMVRLTIL